MPDYVLKLSELTSRPAWRPSTPTIRTRRRRARSIASKRPALQYSLSLQCTPLHLCFYRRSGRETLHTPIHHFTFASIFFFEMCLCLSTNFSRVGATAYRHCNDQYRYQAGKGNLWFILFVFCVHALYHAPYFAPYPNFLFSIISTPCHVYGNLFYNLFITPFLCSLWKWTSFLCGYLINTAEDNKI